MIKEFMNYFHGFKGKHTVGLSDDYWFTQDTLFALYHNKYAYLYDLISDGTYLYALLNDGLGDRFYFVRYDLPKPTEDTWTQTAESLKGGKISKRILMPHDWELEIPYGQLLNIDVDFSKKEIKVHVRDKQKDTMRLSNGWILKSFSVGFDKTHIINPDRINRFPICLQDQQEQWLRRVEHTPLSNKGLFILLKSEIPKPDQHQLIHDATCFLKCLKTMRLKHYAAMGFHFILQKQNIQEVYLQLFLQSK